MTTDSTRPGSSSTEGEHFLCDDWFDPLENGVRTRIRGCIEDLLEAELDAALGRGRYERPSAGGGSPKDVAGSRHGHRERRILGTFGSTTVRVPRARLTTPEGKTSEWRNATIPAHQRRTKRADALIAGAYLSGTNTRRVRRALALFGGAVGKDTVSRVWRKTKGDWDAWNARSLADEPIVRLILDGTVVRVRLDKKATSISLLVALGGCADGQKVLLAIRWGERSGLAAFARQPDLARLEDPGTPYRRWRFRSG
jgi:transposase-like protein